MPNPKTIRIVLTGGGSGGHVYPLLAVAEELKKNAVARGLDLELYYCGPEDAFSAHIKDAGIKRVNIAGPKIRRYASLENLLDIPKFFIALVQAWWKLFWLMPNAIFSKGGPGSFAVVLLGWFYRIPIMIHESDAKPGLNNLLASRFAKRIAVSFDVTQQIFGIHHTILTGTPIRSEAFRTQLATDAAKREFGFAPDKPLILVLGGSQGSQRVNEFILVNLKELLANVQVLHQTGELNFLEVQKLSRAVLIETGADTNRYKAVAYFEKDLSAALSAADVIVSRAGSSTIFEIAAFGKPAILLPLKESANDHQRENAYAFARTGAAIVIEEANLQYGIFIGQIAAVLSNVENYASMCAASKKFARPDAAAQIAEEVMGLM